LRYYIRQNQKPEKRAELRLVVNAGSILENETQLGLAHFVEHTAFNGTTHFAKNDLVKYLQSVGVRFGADLNAFTSFDETVYILPVPTDTAAIVDRAFTILEDWAHGQVFDSTQVASERGVVREEWRGSRGAAQRMLTQWLPIAFGNSAYARRLPIGNEQSIMSATPSRLRQFYQAWYRPDLMAVVAVGDFNPADIEAKIRAHFSKIPRPTRAAPRKVYSIPDNKSPLVAIASDSEAIGTSVNVVFKLPNPSTKTVSDYRRDLVGRLFLQMLNGRLNELAQTPDAPFLNATASREGLFARDLQPFSLQASVTDGGAERGIEALLTETRRAEMFGFLPSELDRARSNVLRTYERANAERERAPSAQFADDYIRNFLQGDPIPGIEYEYSILKQLIPSIALDEVNKLAGSWITDQNRVVIVQAPRRAGTPLPTRDGILSAFERAVKAPVVAYTESVSRTALVDSLRPAGKIVAESLISAVSVKEWRLSNGARVFVKPTDFKADEILFGAYSRGGTFLASDQDFMSASFASQIVRLSGLGKFNSVDLKKKLAGKAASISPIIDETTAGLNGSASPRDLETLLQLVYLDFTAPRLDTASFGAFRNNVVAYLANRGSSPFEVFKDTIQVTMAQHDFRARPLTSATFGEVGPEKALSFFRERFDDAAEFTFVFVGNVDTTMLKPLVERYLASLPSGRRSAGIETADHSPPKGVVEKVIRKGVEPKANTLILFTGPCVYSPEHRFAIRALTEALSLRLVETLREKLGGTYSPSVQGACNRAPRQEYTIQVQFGSSPDNAEMLSRTVFALIDTLKTNGPSSADVEKVRAQIIRSRELAVKDNGYWLRSITSRDQAGEDIGGLAVAGSYDKMVNSLTAAQIQDAAKRYLDVKNYARFLLLPETH
jgi:zinc protease